MADLNLKDDILGFGRVQLKYVLLHNTTLNALSMFSHKKGLFYYDTLLDSVEVLKDNSVNWVSLLTTISPNNPSYVSQDGTADRILMGTKTYNLIKGYNPGFESFVKVGDDGYPIPQAKILFEDIEPTDYTTVITAPGLNTRFVTEKAVVDYIGNYTPTFNSNILNWSGSGYVPYAGKMRSNPGYAYFYLGNSNPSFADNFLNLDGSFNARLITSKSSNVTYARLLSSGDLELSDDNNKFIINANANDHHIITNKNGVITPIYIGRAPNVSGDALIIDLHNSLFGIEVDNIKLIKGTPNKFLFLDSNNNITFVDAPVGGVTPVSNILKWDINAYKPYSTKIAGTLYYGIDEPTDKVNTLNFDGEFRSTALYEGSSRVMTSHGPWSADGSLHAVVNNNHAGFCPKLPTTPTGLFLRDDGTWASI